MARFPKHYSSLKSLKFADALVFPSFGSPEKVLRLRKIPFPELTDDTVQVKFLASPINPADINQIQGLFRIESGIYPSKPPFLDGVGYLSGNEGVAEVIAVGKNVTNLSVGDTVIPSTPAFGTWRSHARCLPKELIKVNSGNLSPISISTLSVNPSTAYRMLRDFEDLKFGDSVIQNGANSSVGQAVIQLGKIWGIKTINIVRDRPNFGELENYLKSLGADLIVKEEDLRNLPTLLAQSGISEPKLALNCIGGKNATNMARNLRAGGTIVTYGAMSKEPFTMPASLFIFKDLKCTGFWITRWYQAQDKFRLSDSEISAERAHMIKDLVEIMKSVSWQNAVHETVTWPKPEDEHGKLP
ncbi:hypothetical protein HK096_007362, partial [Nowakowskiella sp. JEL0078]